MSETESHRLAAAYAIRELREHIRWRPGQNAQHLEKRKALGQLPEETTLEGYDALIRALVGDGGNVVYRYPYGRQDYYAVAATVGARTWLLFFGADGIPATAFPPHDVEGYFETCGILPVGCIQEVLGG